MPEVNTDYFPIMVKAVNDAAANDMNEANAFLRRTRDGKFYRGARWWRWSKSWRRGAVLPVGWWRTWIIPTMPDEQVEFVFLNQISDV